MKKRNLIIQLVILIICGINLSGNAQTKPNQAAIDAKVKALLAKMTLEEKVGQMAQITLDVITKGKGRMGAHGSQIPVETRWKIVHYVKQVIQGQATAAAPEAAVDSTTVAQVTPAN